MPVRRIESILDLISNRHFLIVNCAIYVVGLFLVYRYFITPNYPVYQYRQIDLLLHICVLSLAVVPALWLPVSLSRPTQLVYWFLYMLVYVPSVFLPFYTLTMKPERIIPLVITIGLAFFSLGRIYNLPLLKIEVKQFRHKASVFWTIFIAIFIVIYTLFLSKFGVPEGFVTLNQIYAERAEFKETIAQGGPIITRLFTYLVSWQMYVFSPLLLAFGIRTRKWIYFLLGVTSEMIIYLTAGFRTALFLPIFIVGLAIILHSKGRYFSNYILGGSLGLLTVSATLSKLSGPNLFTSIFVERLMLTPGLMTGFYYEFFSVNKHTLMAYREWFAVLIQQSYPYDASPPYLIGETYYTMYNGSHANANLWATSFGDFGLVGILVFTGILGVVFWLYDSFSENKDTKTATLLLAGPTLVLSNSGLITSLITHGLLVALMMVYLLPER